MSDGKIFSARVRTGFAEWGRYAVYMTAVCLDAAGGMVDYVNLTDAGGTLRTPPCARAEIYLYVIAREFPASPVIAASPPFEIELVVSTDDGPPVATPYTVNQWGGLSAKQLLA